MCAKNLGVFFKKDFKSKLLKGVRRWRAFANFSTPKTTFQTFLSLKISPSRKANHFRPILSVL